jgi:Signal transduction histidine kinase
MTANQIDTGKGRASGAVRRRLRTPLVTVGLTFLLLALVLGLAALVAWQAYRSALTTAEARAQSSAQIVAAHVEWMMTASDQALRRIDSALGGHPVRPTADEISDITGAVGDLPPGFRFSVYDETGRLRMSSDPQAAIFSVADTPYFRELKDGRFLVISAEPKSNDENQPFFIVARRMSRGDAFYGIASIAIPNTRMEFLWRSLNLGADSSVAIIGNDGWLVARHPNVPQAIDYSDSPLFKNFLSTRSEGVYLAGRSPVDGQVRIVGYSRVLGWPLVATTGIALDQALAPFYGSLNTGLALGLPLVLLLAGGSFWVARLLRDDMMRRHELEDALERNRFLLREIHHRVKNNLQTVASLVRLQPLPAAAREDMGRRITAMVAVHEQIYRSDQFDKVQASGYIERLVQDIAVGYRRPVEIQTSLAPLSVSRDQAIPLGLIVNEVVTNAFKHAFKEDREGRLTVVLDEPEPNKGRLVIRDDGPGRQEQTGRGGMGSSLIEGFAHQIGGTYSYDNDGGTVFSMVFPLR